MHDGFCNLKLLLYSCIVTYGAWMLSCKPKSKIDHKQSTEVNSPPTQNAMYKGDTMRGKFIYMADAALFTFCNTDEKLPVAMEAQYIEAERAYTSSNHKDGEGMYITLIGLIENRDNGEGKNTPHLIINHLITSGINGTCE